MFHDLPPIATVEKFNSWKTLPLYFGIAIFTFEGICVILPLENNMKEPESFRGFSGILNMGMTLVVSMYAIIGFFGYWKYGENVAGSITLNLPPNDLFSKLVQLVMALAIFLTYALQLYVVIEMMNPWINRTFACGTDYLLRTVLVVFTCEYILFHFNAKDLILVGCSCDGNRHSESGKYHFTCWSGEFNCACSHLSADHRNRNILAK